MSVLIRGMSMPRSCDECPCYAEADELVCRAMNEVMDNGFETGIGRAKWCPMHEVEEAYFSRHPKENVYAKTLSNYEVERGYDND